MHRRLTSNAIDHQRVELFLAVLAHARQVGGSLSIPVKQVVQQGQPHLLRGPAVGVDV